MAAIRRGIGDFFSGGCGDGGKRGGFDSHAEKGDDAISGY
jgi:hypothetical protein